MSAVGAATGLRPLGRDPRAAAPVDEDAVVVANEPAGGPNHRLVLRSRRIARTAPAGQFVMVTVPDGTGGNFLLPRPMAIHRRRPADDTIELIFKTVGAGTRALALVPVGAPVELVGPLGRGFVLAPGHRSALLIGRGIGVCALMGVAEDARGTGVAVTVLLSARDEAAIIGREDGAELGVRVHAVDDRSGTSDPAAVGRLLRARLRDAPPDLVLVCGSARLTALAAELGREWGAEVQVSLEAHMACGVGYCHGCALPGEAGTEREGPLVCVDGPVFALDLEQAR
jgi:dihydroorotate dehydrogenase electron transfer subunit